LNIRYIQFIKYDYSYSNMGHRISKNKNVIHKSGDVDYSYNEPQGNTTWSHVVYRQVKNVIKDKIGYEYDVIYEIVIKRGNINRYLNLFGSESIQFNDILYNTVDGLCEFFHEKLFYKGLFLRLACEMDIVKDIPLINEAIFDTEQTKKRIQAARDTADELHKLCNSLDENDSQPIELQKCRVDLKHAHERVLNMLDKLEEIRKSMSGVFKHSKKHKYICLRLQGLLNFRKNLPLPKPNPGITDLLLKITNLERILTNEINESPSDQSDDPPPYEN